MNVGSMVGVVLAGGSSSRMGQPKQDVPIGETTMGNLVVGRLATVSSRVVVSGARIGEFEVIADRPPGQPIGPLAGVVACLASLEVPVVVSAVDQPWLRTQTVAELVALCDGERPVVPVDGGSRQVTCAVYTPALLAEAVAQLGSGSLQSVLDRVSHVAVQPEEWTRWGEDGRSWYSVDTPDDLTAGMERFGDPSG